MNFSEQIIKPLIIVSLVMQSFLFNLFLLVLFRFFLFLRPLHFDFFFWNFNIFDCQSLIHRSVILDSRIGLFVKFLIMPANNLILLSLVGIQDIFGKMAMIGDFSYLVTVNVFSNQFLTIFDSPFFSGVDGTSRSPCDTLPKSNIHILGACIVLNLPERMYCASTVYCTLLMICILFA